MHIHAKSLQYFDMVRRTGSIRAASRRLHVASSALSRQLQSLEEEIGAPLFDRLPSGLRLTAAGEVFAGHVITVLQDEQRLLREIDALRGIRRGEISVLAVEGLSSDFLPRLMASMLARYPSVRIDVRTSASGTMAQAIVDGEADIGLGFALPRTKDLQQLAVGGFAIGAVVPPDHPLAVLPHVAFGQCARHPLILAKAPLSLHAALAPVILHHRQPLTIVTESDSIQLMKNLAMRGLGIAFQTRLGLEHELAAGLLAHVPLHAPGPLLSDLGVYVRAGRSMPPVLDAFVRLVGEELASR